jgi:hypothetical protein
MLVTPTHLCSSFPKRKMIDITSLIDGDMGRWVVYRKGPRVNRGRIRGWSDRVIYVVFWAGSGERWHQFKDYYACATSPEDLEFDKR